MEGVLRIAMSGPVDARRAAAALAPDDAGACDLQVEGSTLVVCARATSPLGLLRTLDDVLACLRATGIQ